jgi:hypothetical protein
LKDFELAWGKEPALQDEANVYEEGQLLLSKTGRIKQSIEQYKGCKGVIKDAMETKQGTDENLLAIRRAMETVGPNAALCAEWHDCAIEVANYLKDNMFPLLAKHVKADNTDKKENEEKKEEVETKINELNILSHQALSKQTCELLDFLLAFDQLKMTQSQIQNDFSFYKRTLAKCDSEESLSDLLLPVNAAKAGEISMYLAHAIPMMKEVANVFKTATNSEFALKMLATICNACVDLLRANKLGDSTHHIVILRAMVASFIIYDHSNEIGAYQRRSLTKAMKVVLMVCTEYTQTYGTNGETSNLVNMLKFSSLHVNDEQTPQSIRRTLQL